MTAAATATARTGSKASSLLVLYKPLAGVYVVIGYGDQIMAFLGLR